MFVVDFGEVFDKFVASQQKTWKHDRSLTVGASEAFDCLRRLGFKKRGASQGFAPDPDYVQSWGATQRGNIIENSFVAPAMEFLPAPLVALYVHQSQQETFVSGKNSATPDGLIIGLPPGPATIKYRDKEILVEKHTGSIGLEIKSIDPRANLNQERAKHHGQAQIGLGIIREKTDYRPEQWIILYVDASFLDHITPFVVQWDEGVYRSAQFRAGKVYTVENILDLPPEGKFDNACDNCDWTLACGQAEFSRWKTMSDKIDEVHAGVLEPLVQRFVDAKTAKEEAEHLFKEAQQEIKDEMQRLSIKRVSGPNWRVAWSYQEGRATLDRKAMERDGIDLDRYTKVGNPFDVLRVT